MGVLYFISVLALIVTFILIKKTDKVLNIMSFIGITIVTLLCYNTFACYMLTFIRIPTNLISLSIINLAIAIALGIIIKRKKEIQKYKFDKWGAVCIFIIFIVCIVISYIRFGFPLEIKYESIDSAVHYKTSVMFAQEDKLLSLSRDDIWGSFSGRKIGSYVNSGIIMQCFEGCMDEIYYYKIFIGFGIFILFMTGYMMYCTLDKFIKNKYSKIIALILSLIFIMGYPLNSLLFGFEYMSLGILIICTILHMIYYFENEEFKLKYILIIFALINFGLFCSYYMFVPFTYSALWIYFCIYSHRKKKKIICKENILILLVTLIVPFILGYVYHLARGVYNILDLGALEAFENSNAYTSHILNSFNLDGYVYVNYYSNIILLVPLTIYYFWQKKKQNEKISFDVVFFGILAAFIGVLLVGKAFDKVSTYYVMKNYYALWIMLLYFNSRSLICIFEKDEGKALLVIGAYIVLIIINLFCPDKWLINVGEDVDETINNFCDIFRANKTIICNSSQSYVQDEIEILKYAREHVDFSNESLEILADPLQMYWGYDLLEYVNNEPEFSRALPGEAKLVLKMLRTPEKIGNVDYMIYFTRCENYGKVSPYIFENGETIYQNGAGGIIKYDKQG